MGNRYDNFYGYTGLFPVRKSTGDGSSPLRDLRRVLEQLPFGKDSLLSRTGLVHGARMFVIEDVVYNGHPAREEHLEHAYLVLSVTFDGELEQLVKRIFETGGNEWASVFENTVAFPDQASYDSLLKHIKACQLTTTFLYVDAAADLPKTLKALHAQKLIFDMVKANQGLSTGQRRVQIKQTLESINKLESTVPGDYTDGL